MSPDEKQLMQEMATALTANNQIIKELLSALAKHDTKPTTATANAWPNVENNLGLITRASVALSR